MTNPGPSGTTVFTGQPDHSYWFRVWAKDRVNNETTEEQTVNTASVTKYYLFGGQRVAMRVGSAVYYLHGDHLGSVSMTTNALGEIESQARFTPFGEKLTWEDSGKSPTDFSFTGQRRDGFGLMDYNARFYSASLGRFISPDSIIPGAGNPMAFDRYQYVFSNPIRFNDPTGHTVDCGPYEHCPDETPTTEDYCQTMPWECEPTVPSSPFPKVSSTETYVVIVCGKEENGNNCAGVDQPLSDYQEWANANGFTALVYDYDICGTKESCAQAILDDMGITKSSNFPNYYFVGHSAGADVVILAVNEMINQGVGDHVKGVVLLDPTLSAAPDYPNVGDMIQPLMNIVNTGIPVFIGDGVGPNSDGIDLTKFGVPTSGPENYQYSYSEIAHMELATDMGYFIQAIKHITKR